MADAFIVDAVRTPVGRRGGGLVDDVVFGCVDTIGPQAGDVARTCWLAAGLPGQVPGVTVDRQCGSSQQAVHFAAQAVMSGTSDVVVAGGVQNMSAIPISAAMYAGREHGFPDPFSTSQGWLARYGDQEISQFLGAETIAAKWDIGRGDMEEFALRSHSRAVRAIDGGWFDGELAPLAGIAADECPRRDTSRERMAGLRTLLPDGRLTAALASQISDGAAALLTEHAAAIARARARHDELVTRVDRTRMVLTHGEPHPGNTMRTPEGWRLIDWDTALVAPPERDLWHLATPETLAAYEEATGVRPDEDMLAMYRLRWDLTDLAEFVTGFARPHDVSADDEKSWRLLRDLVAGLASGPR